MSCIKNTSKQKIGDIKQQFDDELNSTLLKKKYSMSSMYDKTIQWNDLALKYLHKINNPQFQEDVAFEFIKTIMNKSLEYSNSYPFLNSKLEEIYIKRSVN